MKTLIAKLFGQKKPNVNFDFQKVNSIITRPIGGAIGDAVIQVAFIHQLKSIYPHAHIGVFVSNRNRPVFEMCSLIDAFIEDQAINYCRQRKKWDLFVDAFNSFTSKNIILDRILAPQCKIIFNKDEKKFYNTKTIKNYDFYCPISNKQHISDYISNSILARHFVIRPATLKLDIPESLRQKDTLYWNKPIKVLLAPPHSSRPTHCIPATELAEILNQCDDTTLKDTQFILCNTANSENYLNKLQLMLKSTVEVTLSPLLSLPEYVNLVASCDLAICIDSATVHIACAFNRPLLSFYANDRSAILWAPKPNTGVPTLTLLAGTNEGSKETHNFPIKPASDWLIQQLNKIKII